MCSLTCGTRQAALAVQEAEATVVVASRGGDSQGHAESQQEEEDREVACDGEDCHPGGA
jgi:hypothetical protein